MNTFHDRMTTARLSRWTFAIALLLCASVMQAAQSAQRDTPLSAPAATPPTLPTTIEFNRDIRPILSDKCFQCHGPGTQQATLRFDLEEGAKHALRDGRFAVVPGDPASSQLIRRITATDSSVRMPRSQGGRAAGEPLTERQIALLTRWIEQGATWQKHWSFIPPKQPLLPTGLKDASWVRNPIDAFVLQRLEQEGLKPSPEAERAMLLRRVSLDLTGLPPTPADVDAFLADRSSNAYEKVVDRLLQSPRYGERMAFPWLDAARYADSNGYQTDGERFMWRWRDWVINAFNRNMPYDQFTIEQLAGDLLPNATLDQKIATAFNRNHRGNSEGGIIPEEYAAEYVVDRVDTTATVFLGLTVACARCHNHKFDPVTQKEFYQLFAYFNNVPEHGKFRRVGNSPPYIAAPLPDQQAQLKKLDDELAAAQAAYAKLQPDLERAQRQWERSLNTSQPIGWVPDRGLVAYFSFDGDFAPQVAVLQEAKNPRPAAGYASRAPQAEKASAPPAPDFSTGQIGQAASFDGKSFVQFGGDIAGFDSYGSGRGALGANDPTVTYDDGYTMAAWIYPTAPSGAIVTRDEDVFEPNGHGLNLRDGKVEYDVVTKWVDEGIRLRTQKAVSLNQWHHVALTYTGSRWATGVKIYVDGEDQPLEILIDDFNSQGAVKREPLRIGAGGGPENRFHGRIDEVRIYNRALTAAEAGMLADLTPVTAIAALSEDARPAAQADKIRDYFLEHALPANLAQARTRLTDAQARRDAFYQSLPTVMVMEEMPARRETHVLIRGLYDKPGDVVTPMPPAVLVSSPTAYPPDRLGLARWLVDPSNPLTARVTANRFWQMYFSTGIVRTTEDFGSQGEAPSHPELLDWLATEFVRTGWNVKALQKTIVMSATYRQASRVSPELAAKDPDNRLLARGPSVRLSADVVRDQMLAISGLLVNKIGGPSVKPYQPDGLWSEIGNGGAYVQDHGDDLYRRSLYTFWRRSVPPPSMANFDASARESHMVRPVVTNTPLQALDLMNDVAYVEAARVFAERVMKEGGATPRERVAYAFRVATARRAKETEIEILLDAFAQNLESFKARTDAALKYVSTGEHQRDTRLDVSELAAYTTVTSLILNLNETVMKE
jgi:Protein of unknown function (DUF1553)/Protein of unknown function (DUF1549)/Concanavalin A-like lectin/glucanases superfamily/Planctomycete cytochrome C